MFRGVPLACFQNDDNRGDVDFPEEDRNGFLKEKYVISRRSKRCFPARQPERGRKGQIFQTLKTHQNVDAEFSAAGANEDEVPVLRLLKESKAALKTF